MTVEILERADVSHSLSRRLRLRILCDEYGSDTDVHTGVIDTILSHAYPGGWRRLLWRTRLVQHARYDIIFIFVYLTYQDYGDTNPYLRMRWVKPGFDAPDGWGSGETIGNVTIIRNDQYEALRDLRLR